MIDAAVHLDRYGSVPRRASVWTPWLVWGLIMTTCASFRQRTISDLFESGGFDAQVKFQAISWAALGCLAVYLLAAGRADLRLPRRGPMFWYACFAATAVLSTAYSPQPAYTAYRGLQHAVAIVLVISLRENLRHVYLFIATYIGVNWVLVVLGFLGLDFGLPWITSPAENIMITAGIEGVWRFESAFGHPSVISMVAAAGAAGLAYRSRGRQWLVAGPVVAWLSLTTVLTVSRTAIVGLVAGLAIAAAGRRVLLPCVCLAGFALPLLLMSSEVRQTSGYYLSRGQSDDNMRSLTGRIPAYREATRRIAEHWPLGGGFQAGRVNALDATGENVAVAHAHNLLLESLFSLGLMGAVFALLVLATLAATIWKIIRRNGTNSGAPCVGWELAAMLVPLLAFCVMDSGFVVRLNPIALLFLVIIARAQTATLDWEDEAARRQTTPDALCPR